METLSLAPSALVYASFWFVLEGAKNRAFVRALLVAEVCNVSHPLNSSERMPSLVAWWFKDTRHMYRPYVRHIHTSTQCKRVRARARSVHEHTLHVQVCALYVHVRDAEPAICTTTRVAL